MKKIKIAHPLARKLLFTGVALTILVIAILLVLPSSSNMRVIAKITGMPQTKCSQEIPPAQCNDAKVVVMPDSGQQITYSVPGYNTTKGRQSYNDLVATLVAAHATGKKLELRILDFKYIQSASAYTE